MLPEAGAKFAVQLLAKLDPTAGALMSIYNAVNWLITNKDNLLDLFNQFIQGMTLLTEHDSYFLADRRFALRFKRFFDFRGSSTRLARIPANDNTKNRTTLRRFRQP
jgi:hypothetical protein